MSTIIQVEQQPQLNVSVEENTEVIVVNVTQSPDIKIEVSGVVYEGSNVDLTNYYTKPESDARYKPINYVPTWSSITGKPIFFSGNYNDLTNKPTTFPPSTHEHSENQITITVGTSFASVGQYQRQFNQAVADWRDNIQSQIDDLDSGKADVNHTHTIGQITHLQTTLDGKANLSHTHTISQVTNLQNALDDKLNIPLSIDGYYAFWSNSIGNYTSGFLSQNATGVGIDTSNPTEKLDVNGNVKAFQFKDSLGTLRSQRTVNIIGNIILADVHNGAILHVTNTCSITIPTGLDGNFQCVIYAKGAIIVTFINGGITLNAPSGLILKTDKMASLFASASNIINLVGELATS